MLIGYSFNILDWTPAEHFAYILSTEMLPWKNAENPYSHYDIMPVLW
jgi:hypothetical protein